MKFVFFGSFWDLFWSLPPKKSDDYKKKGFSLDLGLKVAGGYGH
jgi:hypothetical protein